MRGRAVSVEGQKSSDRGREVVEIFPAMERILQLGARSLTDQELLSVLLYEDGPGASATELAGDVLRECSGLVGFDETRLESMNEGILTPSHRSSLFACLELSRRIARAEVPSRSPMNSPDAVARYLALQFTVQGQEVMGALFLDARNRLMRAKEIYRGTLSRAAVEPRAVLKEGLLCDAAGFVLFHTHPSGDPTPSAEDLAYTRRMAQAGEILGVRLVDHLIVGTGVQWTSLKQRGGW
jgi:DNA repair protein RadC